MLFRSTLNSSDLSHRMSQNVADTVTVILNNLDERDWWPSQLLAHYTETRRNETTSPSSEYCFSVLLAPFTTSGDDNKTFNLDLSELSVAHFCNAV